MNSEITLIEIESAINYWRQHHPSVGEEMRLCEQASALANHYAMMILAHQNAIPISDMKPQAREAFEGWKQSAP